MSKLVFVRFVSKMAAFRDPMIKDFSKNIWEGEYAKHAGKMERVIML